MLGKTWVSQRQRNHAAKTDPKSLVLNPWCPLPRSSGTSGQTRVSTAGWPQQESNLKPSGQGPSRAAPALRFVQSSNKQGKGEAPNPPSLLLQEHRTPKFSETLWKLSGNPRGEHTPSWEHDFCAVSEHPHLPGSVRPALAGPWAGAGPRADRHGYSPAEGAAP